MVLAVLWGVTPKILYLEDEMGYTDGKDVAPRSDEGGKGGAGAKVGSDF